MFNLISHSVQFSHLVVSDSLRPNGLQHTRPPCPSPTPRVYPNSCPLSWWCHPTISLSAAKSLQSCPTLCDPIDGSPSGSPIPGILQARTLEWVAISFSNAWKWKVKVKSLGHVRLPATPWTTAYQAPPSMGPSRQEYWSGVPLPSPVQLQSPFLIFWAERGVESIICLFGYNI